MCNDDDVISSSTEKQVTHTIRITQEALGTLMGMLYEWKRAMNSTPSGPDSAQDYVYSTLDDLWKQGAR